MIYKKLTKSTNNSSFYIAKQFIASDCKTILDVGCACGDFGLYINKNHDFILTGVDNNNNAIEKARKSNAYKDLFNIDINNIENEKFSSSFDAIVLMDVLEHLIEPEKTIKKLKSCLSKNGYFIISLPNVSHASIKANLLLNDFSYTQCGILDKTHLHFYTAKSIKEMLTKNNLEIIKLDYTTLDFNGYQPNKITNLPKEIQNFIKEDKESLIMQYVILAKISEKKQSKINELNKVFFQELKLKKRTDFLFAIKRIIITRFPKLINFLEKSKVK